MSLDNKRDPIFEQELNKLKQVLAKLKNARKELLESLNTLGKDNLKHLSDLHDSAESSDYAMFIQQLHEKNVSFNLVDKIKRQDELTYLTSEPYFARLDLKKVVSGQANASSPEDAASHESIYIGKFGYNEDTPIVTDWRAPIASIFYKYRYPQKNVTYVSPDGEVTRDLLLKRTFEINDGELVKYYNNDLQLDENEIISDKISKRTGGVLEDIIETIQESQINIIESDPRQICVVQGTVGSGKSTVAIHKLAHIFFNYHGTILPERSILVTKSSVLVSYLATLFPKLGIFDVNYKTLRELVVNIIFRESIGIKYDLDDEEGLADFSIEKIDELNSKIQKIHNHYKAVFSELLKDESFERLTSFVYNSKMSVMENVADFVSDLEEELDFQKTYLKEHPNSIKEWLYKENISNLRKLIKKAKSIKQELDSKTFPAICSDSDINPKEILGYTDTLVYLYIHLKLYGFNKVLKFQYCVVDEGQDFSVLEYLLLGSVVIHGRFCILGDLNQSYLEEGLESWSQIEQVIEDASRAQTFVLDTNYRSTKQIIEYANKVLSPYTSDYLPIPINRPGPEVEELLFDTQDELFETFREKISSDLGMLDKSVGVIFFDDSLQAKVMEIVGDECVVNKVDKKVIVRLDEKSRISYIPKGVYVSSFQVCKGLEFSKVYVLGLNIGNINNFIKAKKAFVSVTRAMNEAVIMGLK